MNKDIIQQKLEEWEKRLEQLSEEVQASFSGKVDGKEKIILSPGTKVRHKKSKLLYTVSSVSPRDVILLTPEGDKQFIVDKDTMENEYAID